jgi:ubiquinone/menaquinone biosynthesis C-methylase UbiE
MNYNQENTIKYYNTHAKTYDNDGEYPANKYRLELVSNILDELPKGKILDAGCGTGEFLKISHEAGFKCIGCDFSQGMLDKAKETLAGSYIPVIKTSLDDLSMFKDGVFDHVFCLGVLPYIPETQEDKVYRELRRVIKKGGYFVTAHQNELFDMFTFNKYTLRFFDRNIFPLIQEVNSKVDIEALRYELAGLLTDPDEPINKDENNSARDIIFIKPENPITYPAKLASYGFASKEFLCYNFHCLPPLLRNGNSELIEISKQMEIKYSRDWQGLFMASTFINVAVAV